MNLQIKIEGRKTTIKLDERKKEMKTAFFKSLKFNDIINYIQET